MKAVFVGVDATAKDRDPSLLSDFQRPEYAPVLRSEYDEG